MTPKQQPCFPSPSQLLHPMPLHHVVVCTECRYAIPPRTISRHLRDIHRMSRTQRLLFIDFVAGLALQDPRDVTPPSEDQFPVAILPISDGLQCRFSDCRYLCVSEKRMRNHWITVHRRPGQAGFDWHHAPLQTFFLGSNLRYFTGTIRGRTELAQVELSDTAGRNHAALSSALQAGGAAYGFTEVAGANSSLASRELPLLINESDILPLHHYEMTTSKTIATDLDTQILWKDTVILIANQHEFLMCGILAISALHLAHDEIIPHKKREHLFMASKHQERAMAGFRHAVANVNESNCHAILVFTHLLVIYSFASEQQDEQLLLVTQDIQSITPAWLHFIRNSCSMLCSLWEVVETGPCKALIETWEKPIEFPESMGNNPANMLSHFLQAIPSSSADDTWSEEECKEYQKAASDLALALLYSETVTKPSTPWDIIRDWPMEMSDKFMSMLGSAHPGALILLAHYALLLNAIGHYWYLEGRAVRLMQKIVEKLDYKWHRYIEVPLRVLVAAQS